MKCLKLIVLLFAGFSSCKQPNIEHQTEDKVDSVVTTGITKIIKINDNLPKTFQTKIVTTKPLVFLWDTANQKRDSLSIEDVYKYFEKAPQTFLVNPLKDTSIVCNEGTIINIRSNVFIIKKTGQPTFDNIKISVKEFYKPSDIILANLTTTSGKEILETGGMINIEAFSSDQECIIQTGKSIEIGFPYSGEKKDMKLFNGIWANNKVDWTLADEEGLTSNPPEGREYKFVDQMPTFPGGSEALNKFFNKNLKYPSSAVRNGISGKVYLSFIVNETGKISDINIARSLDSACDREAFRVITKMPNWIPGMDKGKNVSVRFMMPIGFQIVGGNPIRINKNETDDTLQVVYANPVSEARVYDKNFRKDFESKVNNGSQEISGTDLSGYFFSTSNLGWINCDRFYDSKARKVDYFVPTKTSVNTEVRIVFKSIKSIMAGGKSKNGFHFSDVPLGKQVLLVAFKVDKDSLYFYSKETIIKDKGEIQAQFRSITLDGFKQEMEKLNNKYNSIL